MNRIAELEHQIDTLRDAIQRSRRLMHAGRSAAAVGAAILIWWLFHRWSAPVTWFLLGVILGLGGMVLAGSSRSSTDELEKALRKTEAERDEAIDALALRDIGDTGRGD